MDNPRRQKEGRERSSHQVRPFGCLGIVVLSSMFLLLDVLVPLKLLMYDYCYSTYTIKF